MSGKTNSRTHAKVAVIFGTRPEAIKMAPVVAALRRVPGIDVQIVATAQHREMLDQVLDLFTLKPDHDLDIMAPGQSLPTLFARLVEGLTSALDVIQPDLVVVHGDTSTTLAGGLAAYYARIQIAHVEAGLRTRNMLSPWPEEANRRMVAPLCALNFAPTDRARDNLVAENIRPESIHVSGNTVIDALLDVVGRISTNPALEASLDAAFPFLDRSRRLLLVTGHRRENFGPAFERVCHGLAELAKRQDAQIVYPVHLNPNVQAPVRRILGGLENVHLIPPQDYLPFVQLMRRAYLILTDSGGVQEEAPSLGKPVLVLRETTERPEAVDAGTVRLVGTDPQAIVREASRLLDDADAYDRMSKTINPYGDGLASERIARQIASHLGLSHAEPVAAPTVVA